VLAVNIHLVVERVKDCDARLRCSIDSVHVQPEVGAVAITVPRVRAARCYEQIRMDHLMLQTTAVE
jgi:hypothetical protein